MTAAELAASSRQVALQLFLVLRYLRDEVLAAFPHDIERRCVEGNDGQTARRSVQIGNEGADFLRLAVTQDELQVALAPLARHDRALPRQDLLVGRGILVLGG